MSSGFIINVSFGFLACDSLLPSRFRGRSHKTGSQRELGSVGAQWGNLPIQNDGRALVECEIVNSRRVTCVLVLLGLVFLYISPPLAHPTKPRAYGYQGINTIRNIRIEFDLTNAAHSSAGQQHFPVRVSPK